jgi:hypothetical protein
LKLEDRLQRTLRNLGLVRRIAGQKLAALHERIDNDRAVMAIGACTEKAGVIRLVPFPRGAKIIDDLTLRLLARNYKISPEAVLGRNAREEIIDRGRADLGKHLAAFFV